MDAELKSLEEKVSQFLEVAGKLRDENRQLRAQLASVESRNHALTEKISAAAGRLEVLLPLLPEAKTEA